MGFCFNELSWTPKDFWGSTIYEIICAINYFNKKNTPPKEQEKMTKERAEEFISMMKRKGLA